MNKSEKIYLSLCLSFVTLIMLSNIVYQKIVVLHLRFYEFELSAGAILYPLTFLITDLITEFYGKTKAQFCVKLAIFVNLFVVLIIAFIDYLPATTWSKIDNSTFHEVFGYYAVPFVGSMLACYIAQTFDVRLYLLIRHITKGKYLWLRSNVSTCISLLLDTTIVIGIMTLFGILPYVQIWSLIGNSYSWKLLFTICSTPLFYLGALSIRLMLVPSVLSKLVALLEKGSVKTRHF